MKYVFNVNDLNVTFSDEQRTQKKSGNSFIDGTDYIGGLPETIP